MRDRDQTPANWKSASLRTKIDDGRSLGPRRGKAPSQLRKLVRAIFEPPDHRSLVGRPDVLSWLKVRGGFRPAHRNAGLAEGREIVAIRNVVAEVVAHARVPDGLDG